MGRPPQPTPDMVPMLPGALGRAHAAVLAAQADALATGELDPVHKLRTAWRRLRAGLWLLDRMQPSASLKSLRAEAGRAAAIWEAVRGCDVLLAETLTETARFAACRHRKSGLAIARRATRSTRIERLHIELAGAIAVASQDPTPAFAAETLAELRTTLLKRGRGFRHLDPGQRHRIRIAAKRLRDVAGLLATLAPPNRRGRRALRELSALLTELGQARDLLDIEALALTLGVPPPRPRQRREIETSLRSMWRAVRETPGPWFRPAP